MQSTLLIKFTSLLFIALFAVPALTAPDPLEADGRVIVIGIDGGDYATVRDLMDAGRLPNLAELAKEGTFGPLTSTISPESPTAWAALNTGRNPSETGVPGFVKRTFRDLGSGEVPMPDIGHQKSGDRPLTDFEPDGLLGLLTAIEPLELTVLLGIISAILFFAVLKGLLKLGSVPSGVIALFMGGVGAFAAHSATQFIPEKIPSVVSNPMRAAPF